MIQTETAVLMGIHGVFISLNNESNFFGCGPQTAHVPIGLGEEFRAGLRETQASSPATSGS